METKKTAVEWFVEKLITNKIVEPTNGHKFLNIMFEAKAMEKEQIIEAAHHGVDFENSPYENAEQYYNGTYGN